MPITTYIAVVIAGIFAGFINTLAGSGSLITLPILIFAGLPANIANGTNRVAILFQNIVGVSSFRRRKVLDGRGTLILSIPAVTGAVLGSRIAVDLDEIMMRKVIGAIMLLMVVVILFNPKRWLEGELDRMEGYPKAYQYLIFFAIGVYGGFIQAGVGIFLLSALVLGVGYNLVGANAVKVGIVMFFTIFSLLVFSGNHQVDWKIGLVLAAGNMIGAWLGAKTAVDKGAVWIRRLLILVVIVSAAKLLGIFQF